MKSILTGLLIFIANGIQHSIKLSLTKDNLIIKNERERYFMKNLKKLLAMVIVLAMVVTTTCVSGAVLVQADTTLDVWDGSTTAPKKGQEQM